MYRNYNCFKMKRCYRCKLQLPLFMFGKAKRANLSYDQRHLRTCKVCTFLMTYEPVVRFKEGKYHVVQLTMIERLKELLK
jgi:hypothetical protein